MYISLWLSKKILKGYTLWVLRLLTSGHPLCVALNSILFFLNNHRLIYIKSIVLEIRLKVHYQKCLYLPVFASRGKNIIKATHSGDPYFEFFWPFDPKNEKIFFSRNHLRMSWNGEKCKKNFLTSRTLFRSFYTPKNGSSTSIWVSKDYI